MVVDKEIFDPVVSAKSTGLIKGPCGGAVSGPHLRQVILSRIPAHQPPDTGGGPLHRVGKVIALIPF